MLVSTILCGPKQDYVWATLYSVHIVSFPHIPEQFLVDISLLDPGSQNVAVPTDPGLKHY